MNPMMKPGQEPQNLLPGGPDEDEMQQQPGPQGQQDQIGPEAPADEGSGGSQMMGDMDGKVTPEEQAQSDRLVVNGMQLIFDSKTRGAILKSLDGNGDPIDGLAATAVSVWQRLLQSADQNGFRASGDAYMNAAKEIFEQLAEYSTRAGLHDFASDPDGTEGAYFRALDDIRVVLQKQGRLDPNAVKQDMDTLNQMNASGQLEKTMISLADRDQARGQQSSPDQQATQQQAPDDPRGQGLMAGVQ